MASPQLENGHIKIATEIMDAFCKTRIPGEARQVLDVILRKTYGWNKKSDAIPLTQFSKITGINRPGVVRAIKYLIERNMISVERDTRVVSKKILSSTRYRFNKDYERWGVVSKKILSIEKDTRVVSKKITKVVSKKIPSIDNTKDTIQKTVLCPNSDEFRQAAYLFKHIQRNNENAKKPNLQSWAKVFDLMLRVDKRDPEQVKDVIKWSQQDQFWFKVILSPQNLRKQYDRLVLEMQKSSPGEREESRIAIEEYIRERNGGVFNGF